MNRTSSSSTDTGPSGTCSRVGLLLDQGLDVEHLEDALEADERGDDVQPCVRERGQRAVQTGEQQRHRDDRAGVELSVESEVAAEPVDEREREPGHERERAEEDLHRDRRLDADVANTAAPSPNSSASSSGRPKSFTSVAPGAEKRSVICVVIAALWSAASRCRYRRAADPTRGDEERRQQHDARVRVICHDSRIMTTSVSTSAITFVTTPDSADVNARCAPITSLFRRLTSAPVSRAGEERDRHPLDVLEHRPAQVEDQALAETGRLADVRGDRLRLDDGDRPRSTRPVPMTTLASRPSTMASTARPASTGEATPSAAVDRREERGRR